MKRLDWINDIQVLIWDFDGTLYEPNRELWQVIREAEYKTIANCKGWSHEQSVEEFHKLYKVVFQSATETVAHICGLTTAQAAIEMEEFFDRRRYLKHDRKLVSLFRNLTEYQHYILGNGVRRHLSETLETLGVPASAFVEIVTSETVGVNKPHHQGFQYILNKTELSPHKHLVIGDREKIDLVPARELGLRTCLVWSQTPGDIADVTFSTVYAVSTLLK